MAKQGETPAHRWTLWVALGWSLAWMAAQLVGVYLGNSELLSRVPRSMENHWGTLLASPALPDLSLFLAVLTGLHLLFAWVNAAAFRTLLLPRLHGRQRPLALLAQLLLVTLSLSLSATWLFPQSTVGEQAAVVFYQPSGRWIAAGLLLLTALYYLAWIIVAAIRSRLRVMLGAAATLAVVAVGWSSGPVARSGSGSGSGSGAPDVIVIGVDSLRPDHLKRNGAPFLLMPNVEELLSQSRVFTDVLSPQPHTFPATVSVLTGQWPINSGARGNLFPPTLVNRQASMAHRFAAAGYTTAFAMDETRFANIEQSYGFQRTMSPGFGVGEIATGLIGDTTLTNLLSLLPVSRWLLPDLYGNRALGPLYRPEAFSRRLEMGLAGLPADKPLFLYVHFCAAHWPYLSSHLYEDDAISAMPRGELADADVNYMRGLSVADVQVGRLMDVLRRSGRLDNAVVALLSDHGEDFDLAHDKWPASDVEVPGGIVNGHGGSAIREPQVSVLLAFARLGGTPLLPGRDPAPASLVDVAPTLASLAGLAGPGPGYDGAALLGPDAAALPIDRMRYVESSYFPDALKQRTIDEAKVLREMAEMYEIAPDGRVQVKEHWLDYQRRYRQRAVYQTDWVLMASDDPQGELLVVDRRQRRGWPLSRAPGAAPVERLRQAWCAHWKGDDVVAAHCR